MNDSESQAYPQIGEAHGVEWMQLLWDGMGHPFVPPHLLSVGHLQPELPQSASY